MNSNLIPAIPVRYHDLIPLNSRFDMPLYEFHMSSNDLDLSIENYDNIFADNQFEKNNIRDILLNQSEKVIYLVNRGLMKQNKKYPLQLDLNGSPVKNAKTYADLIIPSGDGGFRWKQARFEKVVCSDMEPVNSWLHRATVRATFAVIMGVDSNLGNI